MSRDELDQLSLRHEAYHHDARKLRDAAALAERLYADEQHPCAVAILAAALDAESKAGEIGRQMTADPDYEDWAQATVAEMLGGADEDSATRTDSEDDIRFGRDDDRTPTAEEIRHFTIRSTERLAMYVEMDAPAELVDGEVRRLCQLCGVDPRLPMALNFAASGN